MPRDAPAALQSGNLADAAGVSHGFFTRRGGVSSGVYASLNCGFGSSDDRRKVAENRARATRALGVEPANLRTVHQVHGADVRAIDDREDERTPVQADALATNLSGIALGILTADCAPVLLADPTARVIAAAHAGWRGALGGVVESTIAAMIGLGARPSSTVAGIGPCIGPRTYEVDPGFRESFVDRNPEHRRHFRAAPRPDRFLFDLSGFVESALGAAGVGTIERIDGDTSSEEDRFFSYRRARRQGEPDYGRQLSAIALRR